MEKHIVDEKTGMRKDKYVIQLVRIRNYSAADITFFREVGKSYFQNKQIFNIEKQPAGKYVIWLSITYFFAD